MLVSPPAPFLTHHIRVHLHQLHSVCVHARDTLCLRLWSNWKTLCFIPIFWTYLRISFVFPFPPSDATTIYFFLLTYPLLTCQRDTAEPSRSRRYLHTICCTEPDLYFLNYLACVAVQPQYYSEQLHQAPLFAFLLVLTDKFCYLLPSFSPARLCVSSVLSVWSDTSLLLHPALCTVFWSWLELPDATVTHTEEKGKSWGEF